MPFRFTFLNETGLFEERVAAVFRSSTEDPLLVNVPPERSRSSPTFSVVPDTSSLPVLLRVAPPSRLIVPPVEVMEPVLSRSAFESVRSEVLVSISVPAEMVSALGRVSSPFPPSVSFFPDRLTVPKV